MKRKVIIILLAIFAVASFVYIPNKKVQASSNEDKFYYVSFGDSIAAGNNLPNYDSAYSDAKIDENNFKEGQLVYDSYFHKLKTMFEQKYGTGNVDARTFAASGATCEDLLVTLSNVNVQEALKRANFVTVCIGANNILGPAVTNIDGYIKLDTDEGSISIEEMENKLSNGLNVVKGDEGQSNGKYDLILNKLYEINPNANYVFTTIYNPYKYFAMPDDLLNILKQFGVNFAEQYSIDKINAMGDITEVYLDGGINTQEQQIEGLNQIIKNKIDAFNKDNFMLVDSKTSYDKHNLETTPKYNDLVYAILTEKTTLGDIDLSKINPGDIVESVKKLADPHPTELGHNLLFERFKSAFSYQVTFNSNGGTIVQDVTCERGEAIIEPQAPTKTGYVFEGWYTSNTFETKWNFDNVIEADLTLYAKWNIENYTITYELDGGTNKEGNVNTYTIERETIELQSPTKIGHNFAGWYLEETFENKLEKIEKGSYGNITLYAKWEIIKYTVNFNCNGGTAVASKICETGEKIAEPQIPTRNLDKFAGWYEDENFEIKWNFNNIVNKDITLYAKWINVYIVNFNSNGGSNVVPITVEENCKITNIPSTIKVAVNNNIFAGWYLGETKWDFNSNVVTEDITLKAKWVGIICENKNDLNQAINNLKPVLFRVPLSDAYCFWYVDNGLQEGQESNTFSFTPKNKKDYEIYCVVNGTQTESMVVSVKFVEPSEIILKQIKKDGSNYTFSIENGNYYDANKIVWYRTVDIYSNNSTKIGNGTNCEVELKGDCFVFAVYDTELISDKYQVIVDKNLNALTVIIISAVGGIIVAAVIMMVVSRMKRNRMY